MAAGGLAGWILSGSSMAPARRRKGTTLQRTQHGDGGPALLLLQNCGGQARICGRSPAQGRPGGPAGLALWGCRGGALASHSIAASQSALASRLVRRSSESIGAAQRCIYDAAVVWPMEVFSGTEYFDSEHTDYNRKSFHQY